MKNKCDMFKYICKIIYKSQFLNYYNNIFSKIQTPDIIKYIQKNKIYTNTKNVLY